MTAALAEKEFTAGADVLAGNYGFIHAFTGGRRSDIELPQIDLKGPHLPPLTGEHFELINPGIEVKPYPCCHVAHTGINGMRKIREREDFHFDEVELVICYVPTKKRMSYLHCPDPKTATEARFSMNFAVAVAMVYGMVTLEHFSTELLNSTKFRQLMRRVDMRLQDKRGMDAVDVEVIFKDGRRMSANATQEPTSWQSIVSKFNDCMKHASRPCAAEPILAALANLEIHTDVSRIFHPMGITPTQARYGPRLSRFTSVTPSSATAD